MPFLRYLLYFVPITAQKMIFYIKDFLSTRDQIHSFLPVSSKIVAPTDLVTFTEQTLNRKLYFLCRECPPFVSKIYGSLHLLRYKPEPTGYWLSDIL